MEEEVDEKLENFLADYSKVIAQLRKDDTLKAAPGGDPIDLPCYRRIQQFMWTRSSSAALYLSFLLNTGTRGNNTADLNYTNFGRDMDAPHSKVYFIIPQYKFLY